MELELRLAPPNNFVDKGFDLNDNVAFEENEVMGGFRKGVPVKKRRFGEAFVKHDEVERKTSSLVLLNRQPNEVENSSNLRNSESGYGNIVEEEEGETVSWPHVSSWRKKFVNGLQAGVRNGSINRGRNSMFVKVKMVGVAIGRKVDLRLYNSYHDLSYDLINMFATYNAYDNAAREYSMFYQDKVGDWLLVGGVPWQTFMESVKRIEVVRN